MGGCWADWLSEHRWDSLAWVSWLSLGIPFAVGWGEAGGLCDVHKEVEGGKQPPLVCALPHCHADWWGTLAQTAQEMPPPPAHHRLPGGGGWLTEKAIWLWARYGRAQVQNGACRDFQICTVFRDPNLDPLVIKQLDLISFSGNFESLAITTRTLPEIPNHRNRSARSTPSD